MSNLEEAVKIKEGTTVKSIISCDGLHKLTRDKSYTVNSVTPLFRTGPPDYVSKNSQAGSLCNVEFGITDDRGAAMDVSYVNFYW